LFWNDNTIVYHVFAIVLASCNAQDIVLDHEFELSLEVPEASGMVIHNGYFWIVNDSGNDPKLFKMNYAGLIVDSIYIKGGNVDWEDLTIDPNGNIYIPDFGNNLNDRKDLVIYKISNTDLNKDTITPKEIHFNYGNQTSFPPETSKMDFDCEALVWHEDNLLLFTKNRSESKQTRIYKLSDEPGNYTIYPFDSIPTNGWITSATLTFNKRHLLLLSENTLFVINNFFIQDVQGTSVDAITYEGTQKEAIFMDGTGKVFICDEAENSNSNNMYSLNLPQVLGTSSHKNSSVKITRKKHHIKLKNSSKESIYILKFIHMMESF
jgi:hypothetical protein